MMQGQALPYHLNIFVYLTPTEILCYSLPSTVNQHKHDKLQTATLDSDMYIIHWPTIIVHKINITVQYVS